VDDHQPAAGQQKENTEVFQTFSTILNGRVIVTRDGRPVGFGQPEPEFIQRRYQHLQALREDKARAKGGIREVLADESQGFVERIRTRLGIA
jgi:hypothetical protein